MKRRLLACALALVCATPASVAQAAPPNDPGRVGVDEHIGADLALALPVRDQNQRVRRLDALFDGKKPVILQFAYYHCPMLCDLSLRELALRLRELGWKLDEDYRALTISIDPTDSPLVAGEKREKLLELLPARDADAWPFLIADDAVIGRLTERAGYRYYYEPKSRQYAHPAVTLVLTPSGRVARYLYGPLEAATDLGLALREARAGRGGPSAIVDRVVLSCFHYDPSTRRYGLLIGGVMRGGAALIALALACTIGLFVRRGRARLGTS